MYDFLKDIKGIIHVGANDGGERTLYNNYDISVIYIEPIPAIFDKLKKNIDLDIQSGKKYIALNYLIVDKDDEVFDFKISKNNGLSSSIYDFKDVTKLFRGLEMVDSLKIHGITLATAIEKEGVNIKNYDAMIIDTQGSELLVLSGAKKIISNFKYIMTEVADFEAYAGCCVLRDIEEFMGENSFKETFRKLQRKKECVGSYYDILYKNTLYCGDS
jgi:FkbM family methyltransferase